LIPDLVARRPWLILVLGLVAATAIFVVGQRDFIPADPLWYASLARSLSVDPASVFAGHDTHPFVMRIGLTMPLALLYRVFGISTFVSNIPTLVADLGIVTVVYAAAATPRAKLIGVALCILCVPLVHESNMLNADLPSAALMGASILALSRRDRPRGSSWLVVAIATWMAAFLVKESAVWCAPVWIYAFVVDVRALGARRVARTFAPSVSVGVALAAGYLALCAALWGDPLARFQGIQTAVGQVHAVATYGGAWTVSVARLTWQVPHLLVNMYGVMLVPVVIGPWFVRGRDRIWWVAVATMVLFYWFGSSTTSAYMPLPLSQRLLAPAMPFVLVTATLACDAVLDRPWRWRFAIVVVLFAVLAVPWQSVLRASLRHGRPETAAFAVFHDEVFADPSRRMVFVCSEPHCVALAGFYFGFAPPPNLTIEDATDFAHAPRPTGAVVRAFVHGPAAVIDALGLPAVVSGPEVRLYDAGDGTRLWNALQ
jgi:hypothetical protein